MFFKINSLTTTIARDVASAVSATVALVAAYTEIASRARKISSDAKRGGCGTVA
jgi:hypothetical protein